MNHTKTLLIIVFIFSLISCDVSNVEPIYEEPTVELNSALKITVDPRTELLAVIQHFTSWADKRHTKLDFDYLESIDSYFKAYSNHPAVVKSEVLTNSGFSFDAPAAFVLYHSNPPEFEQTVPYTDYLIYRSGGESNLVDFANKIRDFAVESNFMEFYNEYKNLYEDITTNIVNTINDRDYIEIIENYYGESKRSYNIIPTALFHAGGYGPEVITDEGTDIYNICGPVGVDGDKPYFGGKDYFVFILLHEFSHSFVNPLTNENLTEINECYKLFEPIRTKMEQQNYGNWSTCVNEHLVRANVARFFLHLEGESRKNAILNSEYKMGFIYIKYIDELLDEYEDNRETYTTYKSFYPRIIELFKKLAE